jgi:hypothetical protein
MTYKITHKNSTVSGTPPAAGDIDVGEIAINAADAELYTKDANGNIKKFANTDTTGTAAGVQFTQAGTGAQQRTVESKLQDVVSVKDFGAVGDGVTDDTVAIQAAINAVLPRGSLFFPEGIYLTGSITVDTAGTLSLIKLTGVGGSGDGSIIKVKAGTVGNLFTFVDSTSTVHELSFDANGVSNITALEFRGGSNNGYEVVSNCFFSGFFSAITLRTDSYRVTDCYAINCTNFVIGANWAINGHISGNYILGGQKSVWLTRDVSDPSPQQAEGVRIFNNTFLNTETNAQPILINAGLEIYIGNNIIDQTGLNGTGIDLTPTAGSAISYIKIVDNWIDAGDGANGACITGNSSVAGTDVSRVWIERNTFRGGAAIDSIIDKPTIYLNSVNTYWIIDNGLLSETSVAAVLNPGAVNGLILGNHSRVTSPETSLETNTWNKGLNFASTYSLSVAGTEVQTINASGLMTIQSAGGGKVAFLTYGGDPENNVTANPGSICLRTDTGLLYVKQGTGTGNTGWVAK